jgi:hypothetical protein
LFVAISYGPALAGTYELAVTRKGSNVYRVVGKDIIVQTRYCYVYAYSEDAILKSDGRGGTLIFVDSRDSCDVKAVYGRTTTKPGRYSVTVSREGDDWYELFGTSMYIRTESCLNLALGTEAFLSLTEGGSGRLIFDDGANCQVEGIYSKLKL